MRLIQPDPELTVLLKRHIAQLDDRGDILLADVLDWAGRVIEQAEYLAPRYAVVVANPPYMGSGNMDDKLAELAKAKYPAAKSDLMTMFIERAMTLSINAGTAALVTRDAWMFLSRFTEFRRGLVRRASIHGLAHFGQGVFDGMSGAVVQVVGICFTPRSSSSGRARGTYIRLTDSGSNSHKQATLRAAARDPYHPLRFSPNQRLFSDLPGSPIAYWASEGLRSTFAGGRQVEDIAPVRQGFQTGDNDRFMRFWYEVSRGRINFTARSTEEFHASGARFAPYLKGGGFRKWYGNDDYIVAFAQADYAALGTMGNKLPSRGLYFKDSITWSALSSGAFGARYAGVGSTFSAKGACAFPQDDSSRDLVLGVFNSSVTRDLLEFMGATLDFNVGSLRQIPIPGHLADEDRSVLRALVGELIAIHKADWESDEASPGFSVPDAPVLATVGWSLRASMTQLAAEWEATTCRVQGLQDRLDDVVAGAYGLSGAEGLPVTLRNGIPGALSRGTFIRERVLDLISYAIGCMVGRYSLDEPGLILTDQGATVQDYLAKVPKPTFAPDKDNVIPIVDGDWFEDDVVARFRTFLRVAFGEQHFEENLRFVTESLGVRDIRDYFVRSFYKDHVQRYKKRPIYWLFSSPRGSFNALIYMHRYTPSTVSTVLNEYLREFTAKLSSSLQQQERLAAGGATPRQQAAAQKEADRLRKVLLELEEYEHDVLYPLASRQLAIDLDDGVKANYPKFGAALKKIPGLEASDE